MPTKSSGFWGPSHVKTGNCSGPPFDAVHWSDLACLCSLVRRSVHWIPRTHQQEVRGFAANGPSNVSIGGRLPFVPKLAPWKVIKILKPVKKKKIKHFDYVDWTIRFFNADKRGKCRVIFRFQESGFSIWTFFWFTSAIFTFFQA